MNTAIPVILFSLISMGIIYFLLSVCIQFNRINSLNLQLGMDVTKLYSIEENLDEDFYLSYLIRKSAMCLYIFSKKSKYL
ncbi:MAG: hypothetical protein RSG52_09555 [Terrisporobacter sp.]|uniref:hypothetical protein n=1 Tax=Terrisporobacter sp. TaxID=1965305 RepID=UPI002FC9BCA3